MTGQIPIEKNLNSRKNSINWDNLKFGTYFSDHCFVSTYQNKSWDTGKIIPYQPLNFEPAMCTLHYGQSIFEGLKAYRTKTGEVQLFRPEMNAKRLNHSASMLCIPAYDEQHLLTAIKTLVNLDRDFIPQHEGQSLYIRPFVFGSGQFLGVSVSHEYQLIVMTSPVASYYAEGVKPINILVCTDHARAVSGGLGSAKTSANYAASLYATQKAHQEGFAQVLWLDAMNRQDIDEVGSMNIFFVIDGVLITPSLDKGTILAGITRDSVLTLAREFGMVIEERTISINEVVAAHKAGLLSEVFGTGTAAVISPVGMLQYEGQPLIINDKQIGPVAKRFYDTLTGIQSGELTDKHGWVMKVETA